MSNFNPAPQRPARMQARVSYKGASIAPNGPKTSRIGKHGMSILASVFVQADIPMTSEGITSATEAAKSSVRLQWESLLSKAQASHSSRSQTSHPQPSMTKE